MRPASEKWTVGPPLTQPVAPIRVQTADPPWRFGDQLPGDTRGAAKQYKTLSLDAIKEFPLPTFADDAVLFLWRVSSMVEEAYAVCRAWGFTPKAELVWRKLRRCACKKTNGGRAVFNCPTCKGLGAHLHFGMGRYTRGCHETCILAARGAPPERLDAGVRSSFDAFMPLDEDGEIIHSAKPPEFFALVERMYGGPYGELFARTPRRGWWQHGDELPRVGQTLVRYARKDTTRVVVRKKEEEVGS